MDYAGWLGVGFARIRRLEMVERGGDIEFDVLVNVLKLYEAVYAIFV